MINQYSTKTEKEKKRILEYQNIEEIKKLALISMFSDDYLMDKLVLKGGNAIDLIYNDYSARSSIDIDFSMENDFDIDLDKVEQKIKNTIKNTFEEYQLIAFDIKLEKKPKIINDDIKDFWGGYCIYFKVAKKETYDKYKDLNKLRKASIDIGKGKIFKIDISKYEYCKYKTEKEFDGYIIYVYTPEMIIIEKIRSICQQSDDYIKTVSTRKKQRAKDFFDIYQLITNYNINLSSKENIDILVNMFEIKKVPLNSLDRISDDKNWHKENFSSVIDTIKANTEIKNFDFYFNFVINIIKQIRIKIP